MVKSCSLLGCYLDFTLVILERERERLKDNYFVGFFRCLRLPINIKRFLSVGATLFTFKNIDAVRVEIDKRRGCIIVNTELYDTKAEIPSVTIFVDKTVHLHLT